MGPVTANSIYIDCWRTTVGRTRPPAGAAQVLRLAETSVFSIDGDLAPLGTLMDGLFLDFGATTNTCRQ